MRKINLNDAFILIATAAYSYLFYAEQAGLNFFLFSTLLVTLLLIRDFTLLIRSNWLAVAAGSIISGFCVFWWGTDLAVLANIFSLFALAGLSFHPRTSLLIALLNSLGASVASLFAHLALYKKGSTQYVESGAGKKIVLGSIILFVALIFFLLYRQANPIFQKVTDEISFDFISPTWMVFTAFGFLQMFGFFRQKYFVLFHKQDDAAGNRLNVIGADTYNSTWLGRIINARYEIFAGVTLLALLNIMLLFLNGFDIFYVYIKQQLPYGVTQAEYLHDGTGTLIFSILLAIAILLFVFRGYLNFLPDTRLLKNLALLWIVQNVVMVLTTTQRNWWIIESSGITRKRIGVYFYLLLCVIGLATVFIKVAYKKSNWYLFRKNAWAFYIVLVAACCVNWDAFIVTFNMEGLKKKQFTYIDNEYQAQLGHGSLAVMCRYYTQQNTLPVNSALFTPRVMRLIASNYRYLRNNYAAKGWQSYCHSKQVNMDAVSKMLISGQLQLPAVNAGREVEE